jgi:polyhydroxyalkanoate synthase
MNGQFGNYLDPKQIMDMQEKYFKASQLLSNPPGVEVGTTPSEVVYRDGKMQLLRYEPMTSETLGVPILVTYALVNKPYILDLQPDKSVVATLLKAGFEVYLIDWGTPTAGDKYLRLDDYVNGYIMDCVNHVCDAHGLDKVTLLGYCMGGTLSVMFSCLHPDKVKNLVLMASPLDSDSDDGLLRLWAEEEYFDVDKIVDTIGNIPGSFLNFAYTMLNPVNNMYSKYHMFADKVDNQKFVEMFFRMEKWANDGIPVAGETFREFIQKIYQRNELVRNRMTINGTKVELGNLKMPILNIVAQHDHLVPPSSSTSFTDLVPSSDKELLLFPTGHIGLSVSSGSHAKLWPKVIDWLSERSSLSTPPSTLSSPSSSSSSPGHQDEVPAHLHINSIKGIGKKTAKKLHAHGIKDISDLAKADLKAVARATRMPLSKVKDWMKQASDNLENN